MRLPRRATRPRHVEPTPPANHEGIDGDSGGEATGWDLADYLAVLGIVLVVVGLILAILPRTRSGGVLVPIGFGLMAGGSYAARKKDKSDR
jgi:hypothetical protein